MTGIFHFYFKYPKNPKMRLQSKIDATVKKNTILYPRLKIQRTESADIFACIEPDKGINTNLISIKLQYFFII